MIKIDDFSRIRCEEDNYVLEYKVEKGIFKGVKAVGLKWQVGGYFPTLVSLAEDWVSNAP